MKKSKLSNRKEIKEMALIIIGIIVVIGGFKLIGIGKMNMK